jgi:hypothetical protein
MKVEKNKVAIPSLERAILHVRGHKVMLDSDLARLYGVPTKRLNEAVKRNSERFPEDFMFQLSREEVAQIITALQAIDNQYDSDLRSQIATSSPIIDNNQYDKHGGKRTLPYAFTEQGVAMLSGVLKSKRAIEVNIAIMRAFVSLRGMMRSQDTITQELAKLKRQYKNHDDDIKTIFLLIDEIMKPEPVPPKRRIGYI